MIHEDVDIPYVIAIWLCSTKVLFYIFMPTIIESNISVTCQRRGLNQTFLASHSGHIKM